MAAGLQAAGAPGVSAAAGLAAQSRIGRRRADPDHHRSAAAEPDAADDPAGAGISAVDPVALSARLTRLWPRTCRTGARYCVIAPKKAWRLKMNRLAP